MVLSSTVIGKVVRGREEEFCFGHVEFQVLIGHPVGDVRLVISGAGGNNGRFGSW